MRKLLSLVPIMALLLCGFACPGSQPLEQSARDAVATAKGYLDSAKQHHPECATADATAAASTNCAVIAKGVAAKDTVIDAVNIYCASPDYSSNGGTCTPNKDLQPKLQEALSNLNQTITDVKAIGGK